MRDSKGEQTQHTVYLWTAATAAGCTHTPRRGGRVTDNVNASLCARGKIGLKHTSHAFHAIFVRAGRSRATPWRHSLLQDKRRGLALRSHKDWCRTWVAAAAAAFAAGRSMRTCIPWSGPMWATWLKFVGAEMIRDLRSANLETRGYSSGNIERSERHWCEQGQRSRIWRTQTFPMHQHTNMQQTNSNIAG
jgi:hypothetical protein